MKTPWRSSKFNEYLGEIGPEAFVVYNNFTGALLKLNRDLYRMLVTNRLHKIRNEKHIQLLSDKKIIVSTENDEVQELISVKEKHIQEVTAIGLQILPTLYCNFACPYCYEQLPDHFETMSQEVMDAIISHLKKKIEPTTRFLSVMWYGGEPLMAMDCIQSLSRRFLDICQKHSLEYNSAITTNGYLMNEKNSQILMDGKVTTYQITLDGPAKMHDQRRVLKNGGKTWNTIVENLKNITDAGMNITLRMNVDKTNIHSVEDLVKDLQKHGIKDQVRMSLGIVTDEGSACRGMEDTLITVEEINDIVKQRDWETLLVNDPDRKLRRVKPDFIGCVATARNSIIVGPKGELYKCPKVVGINDETCGSIFELNDQHDNFRKWEKCDNLHIDTCKDCSLLPICDGLGCSYDHTIQNKNIFACDQEQLHNYHVNQLIQYYRQKTSSNKPK